ncbi:bifunctional DNA primase/polymerase [Methylobacterium sp. 391_Methyba4]|uniref:bifunctional DNA primase/polymerase n=1 Tax=Methylobacterium sp. 391_Methyba4 TaxID=3038924 RepID=UPI00241EEECD|nr:bifunctional DNA primase/polymerase [Methylobacterium sp. 391_Methyba4]WFS07762.1 AAA family ATPase [Methylobacterium sp. 391_Methyba4]
MSAAPMSEHSFLDQALALAARGFFVFPIIAGGKTPAIKDNLLRATRDPAVIRAWWVEQDPILGAERHHEYNIGIATHRFGESGHLLVLDVDVKKGARGRESLAELQLVYGDDELVTMTVGTTTGGEHRYFLVDAPAASTASRVAPGLDTRGEGGYVVAPGSIVDGKAYTAQGGTLRAAPAWLVEAAGKPAPRTRTDGNVVCLLDMQPALDRARDWLLDKAPLAIEGAGGDLTTYRVACDVKDFGLSELSCLEMMAEHWNPRCAPPWEWESLAVKVANAYSYGREPPGVRNPTVDFEPVTEEEAEIPTEQPEPLSFTRPIAFAGRDPPPREWLVDGLIPRRKTTILTGDGGVGKSLLGQQLLTCVDQGADWLGRKVVQGRVLGVFSEDDTDELWRRQRDIGAPLEKLEGTSWWSADDLAAGGCVLMDFTREHPAGKATAFFEKLRRAIAEIRPAVVLLDPVANMFGGSELDRVQVTGFVNRVANRLCVEFDTTVVLIAHPSVSGMAEGSGRSGSTGWANAVRSRLYLTRPEKDQSGNGRILRTTKANYGKLGAEILLEWRAGALHLKLDKEGRPVDPALAAEAAFMDALRTLIEQERYVSAKDRASTFAPRVMRLMSEANDVSESALEAAMHRLLERGAVRLGTVRKNRKDLDAILFGDAAAQKSAAECFENHNT